MAYEIGHMTRADLDRAVDWADAEGWNPGLHDARPFFGTDPEGFQAGRINGRMIASISAVAYGPGFAFVGFYIVAPEWRGKGHGLRLWETALARVADRCVGLDGVLAQQANYERSGFKLSHRNIRFEGRGTGEAAHPKRAAEFEGIVPLEWIAFEEVAAFDARHFPAPRERFLRPWLAMPNAVGLAVRANDRLSGYGVIRTCRRGNKIGPLFAESEEDARRLFRALAARAESDAPVFLDVPQVNARAMGLAREHRMTPCFETVRMYTRPVPPHDTSGVFGVTTFELG